MQPLRPQGHLAPPRLTTTWPISPAAPRPSQGLPSRTRPPPTPVPQKTPIRLWNSRPAPSWNSASVATWTSLPTRTSVPERLLRASRPSGKLPSQPGRLLGAGDDAGLLVGVAGRADPDPLELRRSRPRPPRPPRASPPPSPRRRPAGPPLVGVGRRASPQHLAAGVDDRRLDLRPAEVDAAAQRQPRASVYARDPTCAALWKASVPVSASVQTGLALWWAKRRWYERNRRLAAAPADRPPRRPRRLLHPPPGRGRGAGGARRGAADDRRRHAARAGLLADARAGGADRDRRRLLPQPQHDDRRPGAGRRSATTRCSPTAASSATPSTASTTRRCRSPGRASPRRARCEIGANCWFGVNCVVTSGVTIGERCVIGANSVVNRDLPPATIAAGAPAKPIDRKIDFAAGARRADGDAPDEPQPPSSCPAC